MPMLASPPMPMRDDSRDALALGLHLGAREVGLAVLTRQEVLRFQVVNLRKIRSREQRELRVRRVVSQILHTLGPSRLALVAPRGTHDDPFVDACCSWLHAETRARGIELVPLTPEAVRVGCSQQGEPRTAATVARSLAGRYPSLTSKAQYFERPTDGHPRRPLPLVRLRTARERYWGRAFLAAGAAMQTLGAELR